MALGPDEHRRMPGRRCIRWTKRRRRAFLDHLAASCNVRAAAAAAGVGAAAIYCLRRRDPAFAAEWREALLLGYEMLETQLVGHAMAGGGRMMENGAGEPIDVDLALRLLAVHRNGLAGKPPRGGPPLKAATREETDAAILHQLDIYERRMKAEAAVPALPALPAPDGD